MQLPTKYSTIPRYEKWRVREEYTRLQGGLCHYCKQPLKDAPRHTKKINWRLFPKSFLNYPIHLHHCHTTDNTIGVVHAYCNAVLWQYHGE